MHADPDGDRTVEPGTTSSDARATTPGPGTPPETTAVAAADAVARALGLLHGRGSATGRTILGIAGPPAAGKSTLARHLVAEVVRAEGPEAAAYLPLDGFHLSNAQLDRLGLQARKGAPETFDSTGYLALLRRVAAERFHDIYVPDFDRTLDESVAACHVIRPHTRLVVTEGNYLASADSPWPAVRSLLRELWYVDADDAARHARLVARHTAGGQDQHAAGRRIALNDHPNGEYVKAGRATCTWAVRIADLPEAAVGRSVS